MTYAYVFGPVASSRLGRSLGLDILGKRICSMDCLYCEVGATDILTLERAPWVPAETILAELAHWAEHMTIPPDYITLGGSGEPCLNSDLATIIQGCRAILPHIPVAVLTNATLLDNDDVRADLALADAVLPSLDSLVEREFRRINRTCGNITAAQVAQGIARFAQEYNGSLFLEVLLVEGINDSQENLHSLQAYLRGLGAYRPARIDVTTLSRPGTWPEARPVSPEVLAHWRASLEPLAAHSSGTILDASKGKAPSQEAHTPHNAPSMDTIAETTTTHHIAEAILRSLQRRPQSVAQLATALAQHEEQIVPALRLLEQQGRITQASEAALLYDALGNPFWSITPAGLKCHQE